MINLLRLSENRYKIGLDESALIDTVRENRIYYYRILCKYGFIQVHDNNKYYNNNLSAYTNSRKMIKKLMSIEGVKVYQYGDKEVRVLFTLTGNTFNNILDLLKVRKKRQVNDTNKEKARERMLKLREEGKICPRQKNIKV